MTAARNQIRLALMLGLLLTLASPAQAHFIWVYPADGMVKLVFGEGLEPDEAQFLAGLSAMEAYSVVEDQSVEIKFEKKIVGDQGWFELPTTNATAAIDVTCPYGVFGRGDKSMFLDYSAKYVALSSHQPTRPSGKLNLDLVPRMKEGNLVVQAFFRGKPASEIEIQTTRLESEQITQTTNEDGSVVLAPASRYVVRGKHVVVESGEADGKQFTERRYYCTLVVDTGSVAAVSTDEVTKKGESTMVQGELASYRLKPVEAGLAQFPRGMTSFGATVLGDCIYVIGGKSGRAHSYAKSYQNRDVFCLDVTKAGADWQLVSDNLGLQGLAIVSHGGKVYRIGGLEAKNKEGEEHDLHSVADFVEFDPQSKTWRELPALPAGRSSHDACVIGDRIYVAGGWAMDGEQDTVWATDMLTYDLAAPQAKWVSIETPFMTRALAVEALGDKLFAIGGMKQAGGPTNEVHVYDTKSGEWSTGPEVPTEGELRSFGCAALSQAGHLVVSTYDGGVFRLSDDLKSWDKIHDLENGRFFHHMVPVNKSQFALIGGSHMENGSHYDVEVYEILNRGSR
jgi:hypothetical protein